MQTDERTENAKTVGTSDGLGTVKRYAVAVATKINEEGKHWWSDNKFWTGIDLEFVTAPDQASAEGIGVSRALKFRRDETPGGIVTLQDVTVDEVPNDLRQPPPG